MSFFILQDANGNICVIDSATGALLVELVGTSATFDAALEIARGDIPGVSHINKFGENPEIAAGVVEDIWDGGGTYSFPTTADITHLSQGADQAAMRGQSIEVQGLDADWNLAVQTKALDAADTTTPVALDTTLRRAFRMRVLADVVADQDIHAKNVGGGVTYATMQAGNNQTLMTIYTIPNGVTGYMTSYYGGVVEATTKDPRSTKYGLWVADPDNGYEFQMKHHRGVSKEASGFQHLFNPYLRMTQRSDVKMTGLPSDKAARVYGGFDVILMDN